MIIDNCKCKKGQVFTLFAIALIILFFVSYDVYSIVQDRYAVRTRISTMDNFLFSLEKNLERQVYTSGFRILFLAEDYITRTGVYISDMGAFFNEAFFNGTIYSNASDIMIGARYADLVNSTNDKANKINVNITLSNPQFYASQDSPWSVAVSFEFNLSMRDKANLARWQKQERIKSYISIEGFEDPIYIVNAKGMVVYRINKTIYEGAYTCGGMGNLTSHLQNRYYTSHSDAPSFLKRLQGSFEADANGIESLVDLAALSAQGLPTQQKSVADHVYFSSSNPSSSQVAGMPSWFRLDEAHLVKYNCQ